MKKIGVILGIIITVFLLTYEVYGAEESVSYSIEEALLVYDDSNYVEDQGQEDEREDDIDEDFDDEDMEYEEDEDLEDDLDYEEDDDLEDDDIDAEEEDNLDNEIQEDLSNQENREEVQQDNSNRQTTNNAIEVEPKNEFVPQQTFDESETIHDSQIPDTGMAFDAFLLLFIGILILAFYSGIQYRNLKMIK